jgi:endonuclease/exonuclease/phosphatase family metal-dependent hydrolase
MQASRTQVFGFTAGFLLLAHVGAATALAEEDPPEPLRVISFNIRYNNVRDGTDAWPHRKAMVAELLAEHRPDLFGLQEALRGQIADLEQRLPGYAWCGVGRDDGEERGEFAPIFYLRDRLSLVRQGVFWLSSEPDKVGSRGWDANIPRIATWTILRDKQTEQELFAINTHFDHQGQQARLESAKLLRRRIAELAGERPVVLTGDFNCREDSPPYRALTAPPAASEQAPALFDAIKRSRSDAEGPNSTWNGFKQIAPGHRIDFVFVSGDWRVLKHRTVDKRLEGRFASDHLAVLVELAAEAER